MNIRKIAVGFILAAMLVVAHAADSVATKFGQVEFKRGRATLGKLDINRHEAFAGLKNIDVFLVDQWATSPQDANNRDILLLKVLADDEKTSAAQNGFVVLDLRGSAPRISNILSVSKNYVWDDNHYVKLQDGVLSFGFYVVDPFNVQQNSGPNDRVQFVYEDGRLSENRGPWLGPLKPQRYVVPDESERGPCFNVANVPNCLAEVDRTQAEARAKRRRAAAQPEKASAAASAASR